MNYLKFERNENTARIEGELAELRARINELEKAEDSRAWCQVLKERRK